MATRSAKPPGSKPPPDPLSLHRLTAGRHATGDGRFVAEQASGGWMVTDAERMNDFGLALVLGPFATLDAVRLAVDSARSGPPPVSTLPARIAAIPKAGDKSKRTALRDRKTPPVPAPPPPVVLREFRSRDGEALRALWDAAGFHSIGDDDVSLRRFAQRNPGLLIVATQAESVVGSGMGGWDGRRGWIYHVAVDPGHRGAGIATRIVRQLEAGLHAVGCRKVNTIVAGGNATGEAFWSKLGYAIRDAGQFGRELDGSSTEGAHGPEVDG